MPKILVTGAAGFIGFHLVEKLKKENNWQIVGLDNINDYYDVNLKLARLQEAGLKSDEIEKAADQSTNQPISQSIILPFIQSTKYPAYRFIKLDLTDKENLLKLFEQEHFDFVVNLAAQVGVRYSVENPEAYVQSNIVGFFNLLEASAKFKIKHLVFASSSSVYGLNKKLPFSTADNVDHPISIYAATKKSNELMAHTYSYLHNLPVTGLRFFTVYGPWGRPDMALFKFTKAIINGEAIDVYNNGNMKRDFTYVDDIVEGITKIVTHIPSGLKGTNNFRPSISAAPYRIFNIGNSNPVILNTFIENLEKELNKKAVKNFLPLQPGDLIDTNSDVTDLETEINYKPNRKVEEGIKKFVEWYKNFYQKSAVKAIVQNETKSD